MHDVPKIVVKRLQSPAAESHPDADLLTAFAEHSLAGRERDDVVEHLARCGDCREIVALALPPTEAAAVSGAGSATRTGWFSWPILRWGVVAAGIVAVTSVGIQQYRERREGRMVSTSLMARTQVAETVGQSLSAAQPTSQTALSPAEAGKPMETRKKTVARAQGAVAGDKRDFSVNDIFPRSQTMHSAGSAGGIGAGSGAAIGGPVNRRFAAPRPGMALLSASPAAPAKQNATPGRSTEAVEVSGAAPMVQSEAAPVAAQFSAGPAQGQLIQNEPSVGKAKPALDQASSALAPGPALRADSSLMKSPQPRWTISSNGALQRSLDGGKTWFDVNIAADSSMSFNLVSRSQSEMVTVEARSETTTVSEVEKKADTKTETTKARTKNDADQKVRSKAPSAAKSAYSAPPAVPPTIFRALSVSSDSAEVWAGGSGGALYHTMDGGDLWVRVVPSAAGSMLTGDIVGIQFPDPRNGTVTTSNAEVWATSDDGQTWRKQQ